MFVLCFLFLFFCFLTFSCQCFIRSVISYLRSGEQGAYWQEIVLPLNYSSDFQIIFEAKVGDSFLGDIAIDDISFTPGCVASSTSLPPPPTSQGPSGSTVRPPVSPGQSNCNPNTQFMCLSDRSCISKNQVCDFRKNCADGSDEAQCGRYYFIHWIHYISFNSTSLICSYIS